MKILFFIYLIIREGGVGFYVIFINLSYILKYLLIKEINYNI